MTDTAPRHPDPITAALGYAALGWRVVPIRPGAKAPTLPDWTRAATNDPDMIRQWWQGLYRGHGVGIACGWVDGRCLFVLDVDGPSHGADGEAVLADLEGDYQPLPDTVEAVTGSGGRHLYYWADREVRNEAGQSLGRGLDVRGVGGQVLAAPTVHPNGQAYAWVDGHAPDEREPADAPGWLLALLERPEPISEPRQKVAATDRPGDLWAAATTWDSLLTADGWTLGHVDRTGEEHWIRPGKTKREGTSATVNYKGSDTLKVFTSSMAGHGLIEEQTYSKLGYLAATRFDGDHAAAASWLAANGWRDHDELEGLTTSPVATPLPPLVELDPDNGWAVAADEHVRAILAGEYTRPEPTILARPDGRFLLYPAKVHFISGEPSAGKTWVAMVAAAEVMAAGGHVMLIDWEDHLQTAVLRLQALGVPHDHIAERFHYVTPGQALKGGSVPPEILELAGRCQLVVIDSVGEAMADVGVSQDSDDDVATWGRRVPRALAACGPAVLDLDHVVKNPDSRGRWPIGSQRKLSAIDGAGYQIHVITPFSAHQAGSVKLVCAKDRHGNYATGENVLLMSFTPRAGGELEVTVDLDESQAEDGSPRPVHVMGNVSEFLETAGPSSGRQINKGVQGSGDAIIKVALAVLLAEGNVTVQKGSRGNIWTLVRPFKGPDESLRELATPPAEGSYPQAKSPETAPRPTASDRVQTRSPAVPRPTASDRVPAHDVVVAGPDAVDGLREGQSDTQKHPDRVQLI